jgi:hypothetical protein
MPAIEHEGKYRKTCILKVREIPAGLDSKGMSTIGRVGSTTDVSKFP